MKLKIERPDWKELIGRTFYRVDADDWFTKHVEPINKLLAEGVEVYSNKRIEPKHFFTSRYCSDQDTHKGLLINIKPIKRETAEDVLKDVFNCKTWDEIRNLEKRARRVLGESDE